MSDEEKQYLKINKEYRPILLISNSTKLVDIRTNKDDSPITIKEKKTQSIIKPELWILTINIISFH